MTFLFITLDIYTYVHTYMLMYVLNYISIDKF